MARTNTFTKRMDGYEDEATWNGFPGLVQPRSPIAQRKDINMGYEHRWTPETMQEALSASMNAQPKDLLKLNHADRHVAPAGMRQQRGVSSLDVGYHSFGTANGQLLSEMPTAKAVRTAYHYESPTNEKAQSPTSSIVTASELLPRAAREDRTRAAAVGGEKKYTYAQPSWLQIDPAYRTNWNVTRDRYNLDAQMPEQVQFKPAVPRVSVPLVPAELEATWKGDEATKDVSLCEMPPKNKTNPLLVHGGTQALLTKPSSSRPSWNTLTSDFKYDWGIARDRYDLLRFNGMKSLEIPRAMTDAVKPAWLQSPTAGAGLKTSMVVSHNNLVSFPKPYGLTQIAPGKYAVHEPIGCW